MRWFMHVFGVFSVVLLLYVALIGPPGTYDGVVYVPEGGSIASVAQTLSEQGAISSRTVFTLAARVAGGVQAGAYKISPDESVITLALRLARGDTGLPAVRVTLPEGSTIRDIVSILESDIPEFDSDGFLSRVEGREGYLFPDTYEFYPGVSPSVVVERMESRAREVLESLKDEIAQSGKTELEILTMASILEKEARQYETMRTVSGILWKRIDIGMPLQVDAVFGYIYGRDTFSPTFTDLEIDSPYNTYKYRGLPPGPIGNPGLNALNAALDPEPSPYLYYLTGKDGTMHYAKTFEQHVANRRFLR